MATEERIVDDADGRWAELWDEQYGEVVTRDADGKVTNVAQVSLGWKLRQRQLRTPSAARAAAMAAEETAGVARRTKVENNKARLDTLAARAARFAKDPVTNAADQLTARLQHEFLARLWLNEKTDDV
jgi:hypothetical protein